MKTLASIALALAAAACLRATDAIQLDVNSTASIKDAASALAYGLLSSYQNNQTSTPPTAVGTLPGPSWYWWEAGAVWGGMIDYYAYTNDPSYNPTITQALLAQANSPANDYMPPAYYGSLGNDHQAFWGMAVLSALEYGFPIPAANSSTLWLDLAKNVFDSQAARWDASTCAGGLHWQVFASHSGYDYKNSISNGAFLQMAARLARYTGNQTYVTWAEKTWDWMESVGLIDAQTFNVYDGTDDKANCTSLDHTLWSYNPSVLLYGTAMLYNFTNGSQLWQDRSNGLVSACASTFFSPFPNATNIAYEAACEPQGRCNRDQYSFKAYLSRWMSKAAVVAPFLRPTVSTLLTRSAAAAAQACSGGLNQSVCGQRWYVGGYDGNPGIGQQLSALETVQSLLLLQEDVTPAQLRPANGRM